MPRTPYDSDGVDAAAAMAEFDRMRSGPAHSLTFSRADLDAIEAGLAAGIDQAQRRAESKAPGYERRNAALAKHKGEAALRILRQARAAAATTHHSSAVEGPPREVRG
jgi:hypothetical protein